MAKPKRKTLPKDFEALLERGDLEALKGVFETCQVDARRGTWKHTALAFNECPDELARWLVGQGADLGAADRYGETPLHSRARCWDGRVDILIELGADVNHDAGGRTTPLHRAAEVGNLSAARALLDNGARADAVDGNGLIPLVAALRQCSNATIARTAPMAELLLGEMADAAPPAKSWVGRLFGREASPITPQMRESVERIGTNFEFHRAQFNPDYFDATSAALDRLYRLFDVSPAPRRMMHDGVSAITVEPGTSPDQHQALWQPLVPSAGPAATVQGEVVRISGRLADELDRNGGANWNTNHRRMARALLRHFRSAHALPDAEMEEVEKIVSELTSRSGDTGRLCERAVQWVTLNPDPIALPKPDCTI